MTLAQFPFFKLVENNHQAEIALSAMSCFGNEHERKVLKPQAIKVQREFLHSNGEVCLANKVNRILADYLATYGDLSDNLLLFISKSIPFAKMA